MIKDNRSNILLIITDQQSAHVMSCIGNLYLKTLAMDSLAVLVVRFKRAYFRLTEMVDKQIGKVIDAPKELLYLEACRIPLIILQPSKTV